VSLINSPHPFSFNGSGGLYSGPFSFKGSGGLYSGIPANLLLVHPPEGIGLIWSAKSACTTSIIWYFAVAGLLKEAMAYDPWPHKFRMNVLLPSASYRSWKVVNPRKLAWVRVIRDPYKRAVSSFRHVIRYWKSPDLNMARKQLGFDLNLESLSFDLFLSRLKAVDVSRQRGRGRVVEIHGGLEKRFLSDPRDVDVNCDIHILQQVHWLESYIRPTRIINADKEPLLNALLDFRSVPQDVRLDIDTCLSKQLHHFSVRTPNNSDVSKHSFKIAETSSDWPEYSDFLNASTRQKIESIYCADFEAYGDFL